jgi:hypothetical protein
MSRELGYAYGESLEDFDTGLRMAMSQVEAELGGRRAELERAARAAELRRAEIDAQGSALANRAAALRDRRAALEKDYEVRTGSLEIVKAALYILLSALLLTADISIVGQVIARFLGYPWFSNKQNFVQTLFSSPLQALRLFPDLLGLTLGVLLIGLFLKVWYDSVEERFHRGEATAWVRFKFWLYSILFFLAILTLFAMASARLLVPIGDAGSATGIPTGEKLWARIVSAILGLTLPLVGAGFFLRGWSCLLPQPTLLRLWLYERFYQWNLHRSGRSLALAASNLAARQSELAAAITREREAIATARREYAIGYREGIARLFTRVPGQSILERVRPVAVRRMLMPGGGVP